MYSIERGLRFMPANKLFLLRKQHLKTTQICWIVTGVEIDPYYINCAYRYQSAVLIFLN